MDFISKKKNIYIQAKAYNNLILLRKNMKRKTNLKLILILFLSICLFSNLDAKKKTIDNRLVGTWWGSEKDEQVKGVLIKWIQYRYKDGTFETFFTNVYEDGMEDSSVEIGKWWVQKDLLYEQTKESKKPDIYSFEVVDKDHIIFFAKKLTVTFENKNYKFVDTRVEKDSVSNQLKNQMKQKEKK